jgi:hypothetical protein
VLDPPKKEALENKGLFRSPLTLHPSPHFSVSIAVSIAGSIAASRCRFARLNPSVIRHYPTETNRWIRFLTVHCSPFTVHYNTSEKRTCRGRRNKEAGERQTLIIYCSNKPQATQNVDQLYVLHPPHCISIVFSMGGHLKYSRSGFSPMTNVLQHFAFLLLPFAFRRPFCLPQAGSLKTE